MLAQWLEKTRVERVEVLDPRLLDEGVKPAAVVRALEGRRFTAIERRGKWLRLQLDHERVFSHLGMTGKWEVAKVGDEPLRFEKVRFDVVKGRARRSVRYTDPRLFGRFVVVGEHDEDLAVWSALGPDPLVDGIDVKALHERLARRRLPIKTTLLDQTVLAGVGNIQATEALYHARIDPRRPARSLSRAEVSALARSIKRSIAKTLKLQEGPVITYVEEAGAVNPFLIYGNEGTPCPRCGSPLAKMVLGGRGTVFCASCQK